MGLGRARRSHEARRLKGHPAGTAAPWGGWLRSDKATGRRVGGVGAVLGQRGGASRQRGPLRCGQGERTRERLVAPGGWRGYDDREVPMEKLLLRPHECAEALGLSRSKVY